MLRCSIRFLHHLALPVTLSLLPACGPGGGAGPQVGMDTTMRGGGEPIQLATIASVGLALTGETMPGSGSTGGAAGARSNLRTVDSAGKTAEALVSGGVAVANFLIAPNNKVYLAFQGKVDLMTSRPSPTGCLLAEVLPQNGTPICVDSAIEYIEWNGPALGQVNPPIQFDAQGAIYYRGQIANGSVLRKYNNGVTSDLINDNIRIDDFLVGTDGGILITGSTLSSNARWIRRITPAGGLQNLVTTTNAVFMSRFPDGDVYLGIWSSTYAGVYQYSASYGTLAAATAPYIGRSLNAHTPKYDVSSFPELQGTNGSFARRVLNTANGKTYAAVDNQGQYPFYQYYPALAQTATTVKSVSATLVISNKIVLAGLSATSQNRMVVYDTADGSEQALLGGYDIEAYHLNFDAAGNRVMFDGLNFSDNKYVIGSVDLATRQVTLATLGAGISAKLSDFRTYY